MRRAVGGLLPVLEEIDLQVEVGVVQRHAVEVAKAVANAARVGERHLGGALTVRHPVEQEGVVARLGAEDEAQIQPLQMADVRTIGGQRVFDDDQLEMGVLAVQRAQQAFGGVALAVVLARPIGLEDRLGGEGKDLLAVGMHQHRTEHLVIVGGGAVAMVLLSALGAMHAVRGEIPRAIEGKQVVAIEVGKPLQPLAALLLDAMRGDATLFTRRDGVEAQWRIITLIEDAWAARTSDALPAYAAGAEGPAQADALLAATATAGAPSPTMSGCAMSEPLILAGDIGGTKSNLAFFRGLPGAPEAVAEHTYQNRTFGSLTDVALRFFADTGLSAATACFGVAGAVVGGAG